MIFNGSFQILKVNFIKNLKMQEMKNEKHNFRELNIWKNGMSIVKEVYLITSQIPDDERFGLISQLRRCSISVPSNIAEGSGRGTAKDFSHFLSISLSSSYELETQLILAQDLFGINSEQIIVSVNELQSMIIGFKKRIESKK